MRGFITFLQLILVLLSGYLLMSLISCNTANIKLALILIVIDVTLGVFLSSICAKSDEERRERLERQLEAIERYAEYLDAQEKNSDDESVSEDESVSKTSEKEPTPYEKQLISLFKLGMASNQFKGNEIKGDKETLDILLKRFYVIHTKLKVTGNRDVDDVMDDEACAYLVDVCNWLEYPPAIKSFLNIYLVGCSDIDDIPAICYAFDYPVPSIACTILLLLVRTPNYKLRLFAAETGARGSTVLCEYSGYSHINYGVVDGSVSQKIKTIIDEEER